MTDGFYVINDTDNRATFYNLDRTRNSRRDINLGSGVWEGGIDLSDGFYIIDRNNRIATFYNLDRSRDSARDIDLGTGQWSGGFRASITG